MGHRTGRRWPTVLLSITTVALAGGVALLLAADEPGIGHFRSREGREAYQGAYGAALAGMRTPSRVHDVPTSFGTVRAYEWSHPEHPDAIPAVLLPGRGSGVPMWADNLAGFAASRTVYAFDPLGDAGLSVPTVPLRSAADQAAWVDEALAGLGVESAHLVGHSFGGATAAAVAVYRPERVASLALLEPVLTLATPPPWVWAWVIPASLPFLPESWRDRALAEIGGVDPSDVDPSDPVGQMITQASRHYAASVPNPSPLSDDELRGLDLPVYLAVAAERSLAGGDEAVRRGGLIPGATVRVWPDTTHSLPMQAADALAAELDAFWSQP